MNSKNRVEHDFTKKEPFIQIQIEKGDVNDAALQFFVEQANSRGLKIIYPKGNQDNKSPMIVVGNAQEEERLIYDGFQQMCQESLSPELYESLEAIQRELVKNRRALGGGNTEFKELEDYRKNGTMTFEK